jgi:GWxTD domain-containing protein
MKLSIKILFFALPLYILISGADSCNNNNTSRTNNFSGIYKPDQEILHPQYVLFHRTTTTTELYFKINSKELLYTKQNNSEQFNAYVSIHYKLISAFETKDIIDSATVLISDAFSSKPKDLIGKIDIGATFTNNYMLEVTLTDLNKNNSTKGLIAIEKANNATRQNFLLLPAVSKIPLFRNYVGKDERFLLRYQSSPETIVHVRYYNREFPLPLPPFSQHNPTPFEYKADSIFTLKISNTDTVGYLFPKQGFYHIQADTNTIEGITIFRFDEDFPHIKKNDDLLKPLRFLTAQQEYESMEKYSNKKAAVDSFWLYAAGGADRARELVKKYYNRVQNANEYFSSFIEGWKSDRGMIYLVFGPPNVVYKSSVSENWIYGEEKNFNSLNFTFLKVDNPFTNNDYRLDRSQLYKTSWQNAVEMWRQGRIYSDK